MSGMLVDALNAVIDKERAINVSFLGWRTEPKTTAVSAPTTYARFSNGACLHRETLVKIVDGTHHIAGVNTALARLALNTPEVTKPLAAEPAALDQPK